jgi:hypothetical protein|nr:MAG TPA: hypothetical protein [Caudoviricetes sp.]
MKWIQDLLDNCVYCKSHRKDLLVMILVVFILSSFLFLSWVYPDGERRVLHKPRSKTVSWVSQTYPDNRDSYYLSDNKGLALVLTCKDKKFTIQDLKAMTILRISLYGEQFPISTLGMDDDLYKVPVINDNPNPTEEQIRFLKKLSTANVITFEFENIKYTWVTDNQTTLSRCVNLD